MFSSRFNYELTENRLNIILNEKKSNGEKIIDLTVSNPTLAGFKYEDKDILKAISLKESLIYKPSPNGLIEARNAIHSYYKDSGCIINTDSIFLTSGTSEAYSFLFKLLTNPGDEVLIPQPSYPLIEFIANLETVKVVGYPLKFNKSWQIDFEQLLNNISAKTKAIIFINPNNPTGSYIKREELEKLNEICFKNNLAIISDEVFYDYRIDGDIEPISFVNNSKVLTFVMSGISKICALPQLKLSWILINASEEIIKKVTERLEIITDTFLSVGTPVQYAIEKLIPARSKIQNQIKGRIKNNFEFLKNEIRKSRNYELLDCEGGWYAVIKFDDNYSDDERSMKMLKEHNIYFHPGYFFDFVEEGYVVLSLITPESEFRVGIDKILNR